MFKFKQYDWRRYNFSLLVVVIILCICSAYFVKFAMGEENGVSYFKRQIIAMIIGVLIAIFISIMDYSRICDFVIIYYILGTLMAAATRLSPLGTNMGTDSYRWIKLPGLNFQPSEICKIIVILSLAVFFVKMQEKMDSWKTFFLGFLITMLPTGFILIQSDLSSSLVIVFIFAMMIFAAGLAYKIVIPLLAVGIPSLFGIVWFLDQPIAKTIIPEKHWYQVNRVIGFLHPDQFTESTNYQQLHSIQAIASGRLTGKLINTDSSVVRDYFWVDVRESDFIFTVVGEEMGFIGSCVVIGLLCAVVFLCIRTAKKCHDPLGKMIAVGISAMFMFQIFANIGVAAMILPNTGLPLPFLSNGISSLFSGMIAIGIILNIGMQSSGSGHSSNSFL
ncbi:MAG: FtsW/RodA/SpoVE family cell cycle protein [Lachnospiraceae bacterium]|nr:FtsW/RodA/SpoVE family cell cycle protein [Lachnospiraceae bacterium]